jgi:DNA-binding NtrC family response regulator
MKLLVIDDQVQVAQIVARLASQGGWTAFSLSSADGLKEIIDREKVDVLMIDYYLDGLTGLEIVEDLRKGGYKLPVILFTGLADAVDPLKAKELDVLAVLEKPLSIPQLRQVLGSAKERVEARPA